MLGKCTTILYIAFDKKCERYFGLVQKAILKLQAGLKKMFMLLRVSPELQQTDSFCAVLLSRKKKVNANKEIFLLAVETFKDRRIRDV